uniref:Beta-microseminoprotein n=1 Tax=Leptobrachium leishanense TaxID=445787 RepID=A0A8C5QFF5_9ANUR
MKIFLALVVVSISVALSSASCFHIPATRNDKTRPAVCQLNGEDHNIGDTWTNEACQKCTCARNGMDCCSFLKKPTDFDKEACHAILDKKACSYQVVRKDDPSQPCAVRGMRIG